MTNKIADRLSELSKEKQLAFGLLAAERFFICYKIFNRREGRVVRLKDAMKNGRTSDPIAIG